MNNIKYIIVLFLLFGSFACDDKYLELTNPNLINVEDYWKTEEDFERGVNAVYQALYYDGTYLRMAQLGLDLKGDDVRGDSPWDVIDGAGRFNRLNELLPQWLWTAFYAGVHRANQVIHKIDEGEFSSDEAKNTLLGQAVFLRGLYYFHLVNFFNNIPLILNTYESSEDFYPEQADPQDVWDQIVKDFSDAAELLPSSYDNPEDIGRATEGAARAFLGKTYLFRKEYQLASTQFELVMDMGYELMPNYVDNFTEAYENNIESIFEIQFDRSVGGTDLGWVGEPAANWSKTTARAITYGPEGFGWSDVVPTRWVFDQFKVEPTEGGGVDPRLDATIFYNYPGATVYGVPFEEQYPEALDNIYPKKYQNYLTLVDEFDWRSGINERIMRYADVLLMYAECQNELDHRSVAAQYVQDVRTRAQLPDRQTEFEGMSREDLFEEIAHQRLLEFCLEGHRFDDIRRWGWLEDPDMLEELKSRDSEFNGYTAGREYYYIPQVEIDTNPNIDQNDGY